MENTNYIKAEFYIKEEDINKKIRIINSFENAINENGLKIEEKDYYFMNEKEIKTCKIKINGGLIPFCYFYQFKQEGIYNITYLFQSKLTNLNNMFRECDSLITIDLSNFNTENVTNMSTMFWGCKSLTNIDLSNCNTCNVSNMEKMFCNCESLTNIDLSNFNTQNVTSMCCMFNLCKSLTHIDLSNFDTRKVTNMIGMFFGCDSLINIDLSNSNRQNFMNKIAITGCTSLIKKSKNIILKKQYL